MAVKLVTGCIGAGKTKYCINQIKELQKKEQKKRCIVLVPHHYSHETEHRLVNEFGGTGLNGIECTSFEKLARELVKNSLKPLSVSGKYTLICRAVEMCVQEIKDKGQEINPRLLSAIKKDGFVDIAASFISEMHRYNITTETLTEEADNTSDEVLAQKLALMAMISDHYRALLDNTEYIDSEDDLYRLSDVITDNFSSADYIWIDKFDEFLPNQMQVVKALINTGAHITITFSTCTNYEDTYYGTRNTIEDLRNYTQTTTLHLDGQFDYVSSPELKFLFTTWFDRSTYNEPVKNMEIFTARDPYTEVEHIANKILDMVRENNYRYRDIGIVFGDAQSYSHMVEAIFDEYEIPYYSDEKIAMSQHPIAVQILSLLDIIENNWDYTSMMEYLRAGFIYVKNSKSKYTRLSSDDIDLLENYVLKYGIEYKSAWCRNWTDTTGNMIDTAFEKKSDKGKKWLEATERLRQLITAPILEYSDAIRSAETASDFCGALFGFMENINLYQGLRSELISTSVNNATADTQRFAQVWNLLLDTLDQVCTALGDAKITHKEFSQYIRIAMGQCQIRTVPSGVDRVFIGSADMNRAIPTKIVFVAGATSGTFPEAMASEGFLSNSDREYLLDNHIKLAPTTHKKTEKLHNTVYKLLSAAIDKLYISYPSMTLDGKSCLPSHTVTDIANKMVNIRKYDDMISDTDDMMLYISSPKATLHKRFITKKDHPLWTHVDNWFKNSDLWRNRLYVVAKAKSNSYNRQIELDPEIAEELYDGKKRYSATRLNTYANCPFSHYLKYGLEAKESEAYEITAADTGTYAHAIISQFCNQVSDWSAMDDNMCHKMVEQAVDETIKKINDSDIRDKDLTADIMSRMGKTVAEAAKTIVKSINCGAFSIDSCEKEVYVNLTDEIEVGGIIDRLDVCSHDGINEYRIIDYKTGNKEFKVADIYNGIDMQPVIYALAMRMLDNKSKISGMYYSLVHNKFASIGVTSRKSTVETALRANTAFEGVTFIDRDKNNRLATDELDRVEGPLSRDENSLFFKTDKNGVKADKRVKSHLQGQLLMDMVRDKVIQTHKEIKGGNITIAPVSYSNKSACTYCEYASVCKFDEDKKKMHKIEESDRQVWDFLEKEGE